MGYALPRTLLAAACALAVWPTAAAAITLSDPKFDANKQRETLLLSRALDGGFPNGPSRNGAFSQDAQLATWAAFESDASNLVAGDVNDTTDVFMVVRKKPYHRDGPPWRAGRTVMVSPPKANGPSYKPDVDGAHGHAPSCVAFVSAASNLVRGDTNGQPDAFVKHMRSGQIERVSIDAAGKQANGATYEVKVDAQCERVAFTSDATNLALTSSRKRAWKSAVTTAPPPDTRQVYLRILDGKSDNSGLRGLTFLASAAGRRAANASSHDVAFAREGGGCPRRCGDFSGEALFFASAATNLARGDRNRHSDVYKRSLLRRYVYPRGRGHGGMRGVGGLRLSTRLISTDARGRAGNGPSRRPATHDEGRWVAYSTEATNLLAGDRNGVADIVRSDTRPRRIDHDWVSRSAAVAAPGDGDSDDPTMCRPGLQVFFESESTNLQPTKPAELWGQRHFYDRNGVRDVFFWNDISKNVSLESRDSDNDIAGLPELYSDTRPEVRGAPSENPATSNYGNYVLFDSAQPLLDLPLARKVFARQFADPTLAAIDGRRDPRLRQVYLRYIGPR